MSICPVFACESRDSWSRAAVTRRAVSPRKREERLRKVLQARERAEQIEEERRKRIEQKIALFDEKTEKVRPDLIRREFEGEYELLRQTPHNELPSSCWRLENTPEKGGMRNSPETR